MLLKNCNIFGNISDIKIENGKIADVGNFSNEKGTDLKGATVIPGLIDIHIHGCNGFDTLSCNFEPMCDFLGKNGTTSWMPTLVTCDFETMKKVTKKIPDLKGAQILGYHLEGPYISKKYKGAHNEDLIRPALWEELSSLNNVTLMTIAPEIENALSVIPKCKFSVSLGHTDCDYETAIKAFELGAESITHTFNAMCPLHHRNPGLIAAAHTKNTYAEIISDGFHVHPSMVMLAYKLFSDKLILVSDSLECTGNPDGEYYLNNQKFIMKDHTAKYENGTIVGGTYTLLECVKKAVSFGIPFEKAVKAASEVPAKRFGLNKGVIEKGYDADLVILDDNMEIQNVIIKGEYYR